jgi:hypothetical protein
LLVAIAAQRGRPPDDVLRIVSERLTVGQRTTLTIARGKERRRVTLRLGIRHARQ